MFIAFPLVSCSITRVRRLSLHSRNLLDCMCPAVLSLQQISGWWKSLMRTRIYEYEVSFCYPKKALSTTMSCCKACLRPWMTPDLRSANPIGNGPSFSFPTIVSYGMLLPVVVTVVMNNCWGEMVLCNFMVRKAVFGSRHGSWHPSV